MFAEGKTLRGFVEVLCPCEEFWESGVCVAGLSSVTCKGLP